MHVRSQSESEVSSEQADETSPAISICESCPGTFVFLEADNTDGWIATDSVVELYR